MHKHKRGFTIIELLVVISIIGLLSSMVLVSLDNARIKARDAKRQSDLSNISRALELYYSNHDSYPIGFAGSVGNAGSDRACWINQDTVDLGCNPLGVLITENIMTFVPYDPGINVYVDILGGCGTAQFYAYWSDGPTYLLGAVNESQGRTGCTEIGNWNGPSNDFYTYQFYIKNGL